MEEQFRRLMEEAGLSKYTEAVLASVMDSIRVYTRPVSDESELEVGASKIGGMPDLPPKVEWPFYTRDRAGLLEEEQMSREWDELGYPPKREPERSEYVKKREALRQNHEERRARISAGELPPQMATTPLSFIAQFNLSELAQYDKEGLLPHTGMLYFFYDGMDKPWLCAEPDDNAFKVIYFDGNPGELKRRPYPDELDRFGRYPSVGTTFRIERTFPGYDSFYLKALGMSHEEQSTYSELLDQVLPDQGGWHDDEYHGAHRIFGHPHIEQGDVLLSCETE